LSRPDNNEIKNIVLLYPIRLNMKVLTILNKHDFIIKIDQMELDDILYPAYICTCNGIESGKSIMGFDIPIISEELLQDIPFQPYFFSLDKLRLWVIEIGKSNNSEWNFARPGYKSSFIYKYQQKRCIFVQEFDDYECKVTIYSGKNIIATFIDDNPDLVWKKIGLLHQFNGKQPFELQETNTQHFIQAALIPSCTSDDWTNNNIITKSTGIIELHSALRNLYPTGYEVKDRELQAWKAILKNGRYTEITPFGKKESE
ncbi:11995_t:CDS:2, partial [Gigaspora rosea]